VIPGVKIIAKNIDPSATGWRLNEPVHVTIDISSEVKLTLKMEPVGKK
jgi:hypothetical protein